ncbi:MAG: hypothetical protein ACRDMV_01695 [Streptosporangiales bacterium]
MSGAFIYLAIVVVWAVVLVPRWLRRHDAPADAGQGTPEYEPSGRVLARRSSTPPSDTGVEDGAGGADEAPSPRRRRGRKHDPAARARRRARRRRAVFGGLLLVTAGCGAAAAYGYLPWLSLGAPGLLLPFYLVHVRRVIVGEHARRRRVRAAARAMAAGGADAASADTTATSLRAYRRSRVAPGLRTVEPGQLFDQHAAEPWLPQPVPLPTYLTAPAAPRTSEPTVSVEEYDEASAPADDAPVLPRAVGD